MFKNHVINYNFPVRYVYTMAVPAIILRGQTLTLNEGLGDLVIPDPFCHGYSSGGDTITEHYFRQPAC